MSSPMSIATALLMLIGMVLSILCNFASIKLRHSIPMPFFLFFPIVAAIIPIIINALVPTAIQCRSLSEELLHKWRRRLPLPWKSLMKRKLAASKPIIFYAGLFGFHFFPLKKDTKSTYYDTISNFTISAILA